MLFERLEFRSSLVNRLASCATAVYLMTDYVPMRSALWKGAFDIERFQSFPVPLIAMLGALLALYAACTGVELVRRSVSALISRHESGFWFEQLYSFTRKKSGSW